MAFLAHDLQACAPLGFEKKFLIFHDGLTVVAINELRCRRKSSFQNTGENIVGNMVHQLADCVERFAAMWATGSYGPVEPIVERIQAMFAEF